MKRSFCRLTALLCILVLLSTAALAYSTPQDIAKRDLDELMGEFMALNGLDETNFSMSYYNTVTGESYAFNDKAFMVAASTFKLPLNLYYYEMERDGLIASDAAIPRTDHLLNDCHRMSLVWSDNDVSIAMLYNLGTFREYKECMMKYFTMPRSEIDYVYWVDNYYCTNMMMDALKYLFYNGEQFPEMLEYMKQAQPTSYFRTYVKDWPVAHKYGFFDGAVNDAGIFFTPEPFCLAVYTYGTEQTVLPEVAALVTDYNVSHIGPETPKPDPGKTGVEDLETPTLEQPGISAQPQPQEPAEPVLPQTPSEPQSVPQPQSAFEWWMVPLALGVFLVGGGFTTAVLRSGRGKGRYERRWKDHFEQ